MEIIAASVALSFMGGLIKITDGAASPLYVMWFRSLGHVLFLLPLLFKFGFELRDKKSAFFRGLSGSVGMGLYFVSLQQLPLVLATSIFWTAPIFTLVLSHIADRKSLRGNETLSLLLALIGVLMVALSRGSVNQPFGLQTLAIALLSSAGIGSSYYFLGRLAQAKESTLSISFSFSSIMMMFTTPFALTSSPVMSPKLALILIGVASLAVMYQFFITKAYSKYTTAQAALLQAILIPSLSITMDAAFFRHLPNPLALCGIAMLIISQVAKAKVPSAVLKPRLAAAAGLATILLLPTPAHALTARDVQGTWTLISYQIVDEDGMLREWCKGYYGTLSYFRNRMSVSINCLKRNSNHSVTANPKDQVFYSGTFEIQPPNAIVHHVENSSDPKRIGHDHVRYATMRGNTVILTGGGSKGQFRIVWQK